MMVTSWAVGHGGRFPGHRYTQRYYLMEVTRQAHETAAVVARSTWCCRVHADEPAGADGVRSTGGQGRGGQRAAVHELHERHLRSAETGAPPALLGVVCVLVEGLVSLFLNDLLGEGV